MPGKGGKPPILVGSYLSNGKRLVYVLEVPTGPALHLKDRTPEEVYVVEDCLSFRQFSIPAKLFTGPTWWKIKPQLHTTTAE